MPRPINHRSQDRPQPLICEKCKCIKLHEFKRIGKVMRRHVPFIESSCDNENIINYYSGSQLGEVWVCQCCGRERLFGSESDLREVGTRDNNDKKTKYDHQKEKRLVAVSA